MEIVYVDDANRATTICPKCRSEKNIDVTNFKDTHKKLKAKCKCGENFQLNLDFRRHYRKKVQLAGECFIQEKGERDDILIIDVSMSGVNFTTFKPHNFSIDDTVELKFTFDNPMRTKVREPVIIKRIAGRNVGAQYINQSRMQRIWFLV